MPIESVMPSNHLILCCPLLLLPSILPRIRVFSNESALRIRGPSIGVSASTLVLPMNTQDWSPLEWTGGSPCSPRDSQESSPTPQFKEPNLTPINNLASKDISTILTTNALQYTKNKTSNELTHWKRLWCWEGLGAEGEGDDRGWHGWMASLTRWTWVWVNSGSWGWTGRPGVLWFMGLQRIGHDWATELTVLMQST